MTQHVIIGGGPAATNAIETIRQFDQGRSSIRLISDEPAHSRMAIPYWLSGQITRERTYTGDAEYFRRLGVETVLGQSVTRIDTKQKQVSTSEGSQFPFDTLLLATGSRPERLPVPGADLPGVTPAWTLEHIEAALQLLGEKKKPRVILIGAGFIGFIILSALHKRGCELTVIERESRVLPKMLGGTSASFVQNWLQRKGVSVLCGTSVQEIVTHADHYLVKTSDNDLPADLVVVAIGVSPQSELAKGAGIDVDQGILIDDHMRTSVEGVYAAGDCAQGPVLLQQGRHVHAIHPTAVDHGRVAGANMVGEDIAYPGSLSMNVLDVCGLQCVSYGNWDDAAAEVMEIVSPATNVYRSLLWTDDRLTGAMFVGQANQVGMLTDVGMIKGMMQTQVKLGTWKDYLRENPFDIRRAYVGSRVAEQLMETRLVGRASVARGFHHDGAEPKAKVTPHHTTYVHTKQ